MTYLAKEISHSQNGAIITDNIKYDHFTNFSKVLDPAINNRNKFMKGIISIVLPKNLSEIPLKTLIEFRNKNRQRITAFNNQINTVEESIGRADAEQDFINNFNNIHSELSQEILSIGTGIASISFGSYILLQNPSALTAEYLEQVVGALGLGFAGVFSVKKALFDSKEQRQCKKYITNLARLK
jgi:hypothetical protein